MTDASGAGSPDPQPQPTQPVAPTAGGGSGLPENVAGALSYFLGPLTGIAFFVLDRERSFVRFHAIQSIAVTIAWVVVWVAFIVLNVILGAIPVLGWIIGLLLSLGVTIAGFGLWLWLMYQAYQGKRWAIPGLEPHVKRIAAETGGEPTGPVA